MATFALVEWQEGLDPAGPQWDRIARGIAAVKPDVLVTGELPFGPWLASGERFDPDAAQASIALHTVGLAALASLGLLAVITSRPAWAGNRLMNEAVVIEGTQIRPAHRKQFFPQEEGWFETEWFRGDDTGFHPIMVGGLSIGVLLCTELMFNEYARHYGRSGVDVIVVPRSTGPTAHPWRIAGAMAAIVSGSYVIGSNRAGAGPRGPRFGGLGMAFAPDGRLMAETSAATPMVVVDVDVETTRARKSAYPCYVLEAAPPSGHPSALMATPAPHATSTPSRVGSTMIVPE